MSNDFSQSGLQEYFIDLVVKETFEDKTVESIFNKAKNKPEGHIFDDLTITKEEQADEYISDYNLIRNIMNEEDIYMVENWEVLSVENVEDMIPNNVPMAINRIDEKGVQERRNKEKAEYFATLLSLLKKDNEKTFDAKFLLDFWANYKSMEEKIKDLEYFTQFEITMQSLTNAYKSSINTLDNLRLFSDKIRKKSNKEIEEFKKEFQNKSLHLT